MKKLRLVSTVQNFLVVIFIITATLFLVANIFTQYNHFESQVNEKRVEELSDVKNILINEVGHVIKQIKILKSNVRIDVEHEAKNRVEKAHKVANHLYKKFHNKKGKIATQALIREALRPIRFDNGTGYYFITKMDGIEILFADKPEMEGQNLLNTVDVNGKPVIKDMISIASDSGEGFYSYFWTKPGNIGNTYEKVAYVKYFKPYDWIIGTGVYLEDIEKQAKRDALKQIRDIRFGKDNKEYIFVGNYDGLSLSGPATGKNMINAKDPNGVMIVQKLIESAKSGGGFVEYVMPKIDGKMSINKISYAEGIDDWQWYIGAGIYVDDIEKRILKLKRDLKKHLVNDIFSILIITFFMIVAFVIVMSYLNRYVKKDINIFTSFFKSVVEDNKKISRDQIRFKEFDTMAEYANRMLFEKISIEKSLKKSEDQFRMLFSESPIGIVLEDKDFNILLSNRVFEKMVGYSGDELKVMNSRDISMIADMEIDLQYYEDVLQGKKRTYNLEKRYKKKDGTLIWGYITRTVIFDEDKQPVWSIAMIEDLTERKRLQEQIRQAEKMETIGQLAGGIAHDFNNQLAGIMGFTELLKELAKGDSELCKYTEYIMNSVKNSAELTSQLLAFARKGKVQSVAVDMHNVIDEVISLLKHSLPKNITISQELDAELSKIKGDPTQIQNAVLNLAINARDAMPDGGSIIFSTKEIYYSKEDCESMPYEISEGDYLKVSVSDTGMGMSEDVQTKIFEPFFTTKEQGKGTGMGLAAVYGTVKNHKGFITVDSVLKKGTTFHIVFPIYSDVNAEEESDSVETHSVSGVGKILLVDDEEMLRNMGSKMLSILGYNVEVCSNGQEAVDYYEKNWSKIDLVILDMVMPVLGGKDAFLLMREINPNVKAILASGYSIDGETQELLDKGVKGFIQKPFRKAQFSQQVSDAINS